MRKLITADRLWTGSRLIDKPALLIEDHLILSITSLREESAPAADEHFDHPGCTISPAFFDVHFHGAANHDVMEATPEALATIGKFLASHGIGSYFATTVTAPMDATLRALEGLAREISRASQPTVEARPIGIHLEGPFLSHARRGVHPPEHLKEPSIPLFDRMFEAAGGHVKLMTLAPELPGAAEFAAHAISKGVRVSIGHSDATAEQAAPVIAGGAASATHTFNAMRPLNHREPSILSTVLTNDSLYAELICDGVHVAPEIVRLWWRMKQAGRGILITDAISATGMPNGSYKLGGLDVQVADGVAMANGVLAGSVLTLDRALQNFIAFTGASLEDALRLLTTNPAAMTGLSEITAHLAPARPANVVVVNQAGKRMAGVQNGINL